MPRYKFGWSNLPTFVLRALVAGDGVRLADAPDRLRDWYGARPGEEFIRDAWERLREAWLGRDAAARRALVEQLWELGVGKGEAFPRTRATEMAFLRSCRNARRLRECVLTEFIARGEQPSEKLHPAADATAEPTRPPAHLDEIIATTDQAVGEDELRLQQTRVGGTGQESAAAAGVVAGSDQDSRTDVPGSSVPQRRIGMGTPAGFENKVGFIWKIADKLRGHLKPHEYGSVMLPTLVLFRLDAVLQPTRERVSDKAATLDLMSWGADKILRKAAGQPFYNTSRLTLKAMLSDDKNIAAQLRQYIAGFSPAAAAVLEAYRYDETITRLDKAGVLYAVLGDFADIELHPKYVSNEAMGYMFEELLRKFSEMSNETAGEHYTPREVIRLMVDLLFVEDSDALTGPAPVRTVYDPAAGTGGMLTVASNYLAELNPSPDAHLEVYGQELNPETWAIACSELMMRGVEPDRMVLGNSFTQDGFPGTRVDYALANPPYGVDWKTYADPIKTEAVTKGFAGRFGAGLPRISDGSFLFLQHMISKMKPVVDGREGGSRIGIVLSGSPLFSGGAGSGESEIRRWIIENDWLEGIVALPDQMFYNTGISTYVWIVTNRKPAERAGTVTLVDARELATKMRKSLGDKRKELTPEAIADISRLFRDAPEVTRSAEPDPLVKVMRNEEFGYARLNVERPMRRVWRIDDTTSAGLAEDLAAAVESLSSKSWTTEKAARHAIGACGLEARQISSVVKGIAVYDANADPIKAKKGDGYEADPDLRDLENIPLPVGYLDLDEKEQVKAVREAAEKHLAEEIHPYASDAWIDHEKTKIGYEIPFTRQFYIYTPPRPVTEIRADIDALEGKIQQWMKGLAT